ncbi:MAG: L-lactate dehydrogenase, partial [Bacilli bacterium]|nr:L-lactate dehydrogenase [Bacilli bacterium]
IVRDEKSILPVSSAQHQHDMDGICLSMPAIVGKDGIEGYTPISLDEKEMSELLKSADTLKKVMEDCKDC